MNYIIVKDDGTYFAGWDILGHIIFRVRREEAYRMRRMVALRTLAKLKDADYGGCRIETV